MKAVGWINSFVAGELGEDAWDRSDLVQHAKGMGPGKNLLVLTQGPAASRPGFWDRGPAANEGAPGRLVPFVRSSQDALVLEFYHLGFRIWTPEGDLVLTDDPDPVPVLVPTPWTGEELAGLWFKQIGDVLFVTHQAGFKPKVITRTANTAWSVGEFDFRDGPWLAENVDTSVTIAADKISGTVALTASGDLFRAGHVGSLLRLRAQSSGAGVGAWTAGFDVLIDNEMAVSDGKVYRTLTEADDNKTGTNPPVHDHGTAFDGSMEWEYLHDGAGIVRITEVTDGMNAVGEVVTAWLPTQGVSTTHSGADGFRQVLTVGDEDSVDFPATPYWAFGALSDEQGWPIVNAEEIEERLVFMGTHERPSMAHLTRTAGFGPAYGDFKPGQGTGRVVADDAVRLTVGKAGAPGRWLANCTFLIAGTSDGEYVISGADFGDPISPDSYRTKTISEFGCAPIAPVRVQGPPVALLFVTRSYRMLRELRISADLTTEGGDCTILASHIARRGFAELAWQHPDEVCWARLLDGGLAAFTFHQQQEVRAWTTQALPGGFLVESICTVPAFGLGDTLWALVKRQREDETWQRRLWRLALRDENLWLDGAEAYSGEEPVSAVSGLDQYEGETVYVIADGAAQSPKTVVGGAIAISPAARNVVAGLHYDQEFSTLPLDLQGVGSTLNRAFRPLQVDATVDCVEVHVTDGTGLNPSPLRGRAPNALAWPPVVRLGARLSIGGGATRSEVMKVKNAAPGFPMKIYSLRIEGEVNP